MLSERSDQLSGAPGRPRSGSQLDAQRDGLWVSRGLGTSRANWLPGVDAFKIDDAIDLRGRVEDARSRLSGVAEVTPLLRSPEVDSLTGSKVFLKAEMFQRTGSFKFRGAYNKLASLDCNVKHVVAHSSGNFAQAVALAGRLQQKSVTVVMPRDAPEIKIRNTRNYGAEIVFCGRSLPERVATAHAVCLDTGGQLVQPFDDLDVIAGQGTVALELLESQAPHLDALVVPLGGGGLLSGSALVAKSLNPDILVIGVEPTSMPKTLLSRTHGLPHEVQVEQTVMDGQMISRPGVITYPIIDRYVDEIVTVDDRDVVYSMNYLFEKIKIVAEPSGASALTAVIKGQIRHQGNIGVILSGGNVCLERAAELLALSQ